jgi:hypothetical protein
MTTTNQKKMTIFFILSIIAILGLIISSIIMINQNGMNERLQGWVNLLWLPLPIVILVADRICARKFGVEGVNKVEAYILGTLMLLFLLNWMRLQL